MNVGTEVKNKEISIVIPVYNSEATLPNLIKAIEIAFEENKLEYEVVLVNDCSTDASWLILQKLVKTHKNLIAINLLKNYGQHNALICGFQYATGKYIVTIDDDMQNPPSEIIKLYKKVSEGYDVVFGQFYKKEHKSIRKLGTKLIGILNQKIFGKPQGIVLSNFRIINQDVIQRVLRYKTSKPYVPGLVLMHSNKIANVKVEHRKREIGKSNYNFIKILKLVSTILFNYSSFPIRFVGQVGAVISFLCFLFGLGILIKDFVVGVEVKGWTSTIVLVSFLGGFIIMMLGMIGEYISRLNNEVSQKPTFIVNEHIKSEK